MTTHKCIEDRLSAMALQHSDLGFWYNPLNFYTFPTYFQVITYIHIWCCLICALSHKPTICITSQTETGTSRASAEYTYVHIHGHPQESGGCLWRQKAPVVCILPLDSHKKCFPFHTAFRHQIACAQREDIKTCFHVTKDEDFTWKSFMHVPWNIVLRCNSVLVTQPRRRRRSVFKEGWGSSACQSLGKWPVSLMQPLSPRRPSRGRGKGWGERRGGRRNCLTEVFLMTPQGGVTAARDDVQSRGQEAFLFILQVGAARSWAGTPSAAPCSKPLSLPCPLLKESAESAISKRGSSDYPTRWISGVSFCRED